MKKLCFVVLMVLSAVTLFACNSPSTVKGEFIEKEYVLSLDEVKNFYDELSITGVDKEKVVLISSNTSILSNNNDKEFKAISSGRAYVFAKYKNKTVASAKVNVKYKLSSPQNFKLSTEGKLTWDKSFAVVNGKPHFAGSYKVEIGQIIDLVSEIEYTTQTVEINSIDLPKKASYSIKITAISDNELIDDSIQVINTFHYGVMGILEDVNFQVDDTYNSQIASISWNDKVNAVYDIYVEGFKLKKDSIENSYTFDYSIYNGGDVINIEVVAKDKEGKKSSTSTKIDVNLLENPKLNYSYNKEGKLVWLNDLDATSYRFKIQDFDGNITYHDVIDSSENFTTLDDKNEGIYYVELVAIGGNKEGFFVSSKPSENLKVAKLPTPQVEVEFVDNKAKINFVQHDYISEYKLTWNNQSIYYSTTNGLSTEIDISNLNEGIHTLNIKALPTEETASESGVASYAYKTETTNMVLNSNPVEVEFYVLGQLGEINHVLNDNVSTLTFPALENANFYRVYVNGIYVQDASILINEEIVVCEIKNLKYYTPKDNGYDIKVVAGRIDDSTGKEISTRSEKIKRLEILDTPTAKTSNPNGTFGWLSIGVDCKYSYQVFKTESNYILTEGQTPVLSEENIENLQISQILDEGYYKIKVKTLSKNKNLYLDSDFYDKNNVLESNFYVTQEILQPTATFFVDGKDYKLNITTVDFASLYEVYVDGNIDGQIASEGLQQETYTFKSTFESAGKHQVTVQAKAGSKYDGTIYLDSTKFQLNVNRLALPEYMVNITYPSHEENNHEILTVKEVANSTKVVFFLDGEEVTGENYLLDLINYDAEFKIGLILKAGNNQGNEYYIDSQLKEIDFTRASFPSLIKYTSGNLTWNQNQVDAANNKISIILDTESSSDYFKRFDVPINPQQIDLQEKIDSLRKTDIAFDTAYRQVEKIQIKMLSFMNKESDKYYLPSFYGTVSSNGTNTLEIGLLDSPELKFDVDNKLLSWEFEIENTIFDIYVDDKLIKEGHTLTSINLIDLGELDFTTQKKITVRARNLNYLDSDISSPIYIKELVTPTTLNVAKDGKDYRASISIDNDITHITQVKVNGSADNVNYQVGGNIASFVLSDFTGTTEFAINLIAKNESTLNYYLSSAPVNFTLVNLADQEFEAQVTETSIVWSELGKDISGNNINPIRYILSFTNNGETFTYTTESETKIELSKLETIAKKELFGEIKATVKVCVTEDYSLSAVSVISKGYYGENSSEELTTNKLETISDVAWKVVDGTGTSEIERKINSSLQVTFPDKWEKFSGVSFVIAIKVLEKPIVFPQEGVNNLIYAFTKVDDDYLFTLSYTALQMFDAGNIEVQMYAQCAKQISTNVYKFNLSKFNTTTSAQVSDDGKLTIKDTQSNASYLIQIAIEETNLESSILQSSGTKELNLMVQELLLNRFGSFTIKILTFDENNLIIPADETLTVTGYKIQGIEEVYVDDAGYVNLIVYMDDLANIVFTAQFQNKIKQFTPTLEENTVNHFKISMLDLIKLYSKDIEIEEGECNFKFAIKSSGSIDSAWKELVFNYALDETPLLTRANVLDKDYIIFNQTDKSDTISFRTYVKATYIFENVNEEDGTITYTYKNIIKEIIIPANTIFGFWATDLNGENGYFTTTKGSEIETIYTECYAVSVNDILSDLAYGSAKISVSRIGKKEETYYQYNEFDFEVYKLNKVNEVVGDTGSLNVKDNYLTFTWTQKDTSQKAKDKKPTAYYVTFVSETGEETRVTTYVCSLDLRTVGLTSGKSYNIFIKAVSAEKDIVASDNSTSVASLRYTTPIKLQVEDGILTFDETEFRNTEFIQDIISYFAQATEENIYHNQTGSKQYKQPYFFTPNVLKELYVTLQFTKLDATGGITNQVYNVNTLGYWLFPDLEIEVNLSDYIAMGEGNSNSYYTLLERYYNNIIELEETEAKNIASMIEALKTSPRGIGDNSILFDDIGRSIPAGDYQVCVFQTKSGQYVESARSEAVTMTISASSEVSIQTVVEDNLIQYTADFTPVSTLIYVGEDGDGNPIYQTSVATRYKLALRVAEQIGVNYENKIDFIITYDGTNWLLSYLETSIDGVIKNNDNYNDGIPGFTINMSALRRVINTSTGEETIPANLLMRADLFVYNQDDGRVINGKSATFNVRYLDLKADYISFEEGRLTVSGDDIDDNFELYVKFNHSSTQSFLTTKFVDGKTTLNFVNEGLYSYIVLSLNGSISANTMNVESASYAIENLYKLNTPTLSTSNGNIVISYNSSDLKYMSTLGFYMGNNVSLDAGYNGDDKGYYFDSLITSSSGLTPYVVGSADLNGKVNASEFSATSFHSYLKGNTGTFTLSDTGHAMADYLLTFSEPWAVLSSDQEILQARMLNDITNLKIAQGHLEIDDERKSQGALYDEEQNENSANVVYEVVLIYCINDNSNEGEFLEVAQDVFYTERAYDGSEEYYAQVISGLLFNKNYDMFKVSVTALGGIKADKNSSGAIKTIEETYVLIKNRVYYQDGSQVLRSKTKQLSNIIYRTTTPYLDIDKETAKSSDGIANGNIEFVIDKSIYFSDTKEGDKNSDTAKRISIYAEYNQDGNSYQVEITGKYIFDDARTEADSANKVYVTFIPDEGQLNQILNSFNVKIFIYGNDTIISLPLEIKDIYKLKNVQERYYDIELYNGNTVINLEKYFSQVSVNHDNTCYIILIKYKLDDGSQLNFPLSESDAQKFIIPDRAVEVSIQVQDGQEIDEVTPKKLFYSDTTLFNIEKTSVEGLTLKWNSEEMRFEWSWDDGRIDEYEYYVTITVGSTTRTELVTTNYYLPKDRGTIKSGGFTLRARKLNAVDSSNFSTFSESKAYEGEEVLYSLYSGGNGSKSNPYIINNSTDFINMSKRNTSEFYFKLGVDDIVVDLADLYQIIEGEKVFLMQDFNAHLDGNDYSITVISSQIHQLDQEFKPSLIGKPNLAIKEYSSLFRNVSATATISNLLIDYQIKYSELYDSSIMFSPICAFNYGIIDNVNISSVTITTLNGRGDENVALVGGIASVNYGTIKNSKNSAVLNYTMAQQLNLTFGYAGITLFNTSISSYIGSVENCFNQGAKNISVTTNNNLVYLAGIALTNSGRIAYSGNDGNLTLSARTNVNSMTGYFAGIVVANNNGTLEYVYNNATIKNTSTYGTFNYGGIAYQISSGKINYLVVTVSGQPIVKSCSTPPSDVGSNYASSDSGTSQYIATKELTQQTIDAGNGYTLTITQTGTSYIASITKA